MCYHCIVKYFGLRLSSHFSLYTAVTHQNEKPMTPCSTALMLSNPLLCQHRDSNMWRDW